MRLIKKIDLTTRNSNSDSVEKRIAARAITLKGDKVLMIYIEKDNTYSFPGGGVQFNESLEDACIRELEEETGAQGVEILSEFGYIDEFRDSKYHTDKVYNMISYYYLCKIQNLNGNMKLEQYEESLGFNAVWVKVSKALEHNKEIINKDESIKRKIRYLTRSITVLEELERRL